MTQVQNVPSSPALVAVVDDDDDVRFSLEALVASMGYDVASFASADLLLGSSTLKNVSCVVSDVQMPGTSGIQLARKLQRDSGPPIILITAFGTRAVEEQAREAGATCFLRKPFPPTELMDELDRLLV